MNNIFYHWSHRERKKAVIRRGLLPGQWSRDRLWRPPYICLGPSPQIAWLLSGGMNYPDDATIWDLWEVWTGDQQGYEELYFDSGRLKEIRVYDRIFKRNVWWVGERENGDRNEQSTG